MYITFDLNLIPPTYTKDQTKELLIYLTLLCSKLPEEAFTPTSDTTNLDNLNINLFLKMLQDNNLLSAPPTLPS